MRKYTPILLPIVLFALLFAAFPGCKPELLSPSRYSDSTIVAGSDSAGFANGTGTAARFNHPFGLTVDKAGNLYVADQGNDLIRMITPGGVVSTYAGTVGIIGFTNGAATLARFNKAFSVAADTSGNIYVADGGNNVIRLITPSGTVSNFAGSGVAGAADGTDTATFNSPLGVATDKAGNVYVADYGNDLIRKINQAGAVSTIAGKTGVAGAADGLDTAARFNLPESLAVDASGNIYVADNGNNLIRKITPAGMVSTLAGNGKAGFADGTGAAASFNSPFGIAVDGAGNIYVADSGNNRIRKITPAGAVSTFAGSSAKGAHDATGGAATFNTPSGVCVDMAGNVWVADENNNLIRKITTAGTVSTIASMPAKGIYKLIR
ncbi:MAG: NHL repeat-containing protein [Sphingobacteriales bacterium]